LKTRLKADVPLEDSSLQETNLDIRFHRVPVVTSSTAIHDTDTEGWPVNVSKQRKSDHQIQTLQQQALVHTHITSSSSTRPPPEKLNDVTTTKGFTIPPEVTGNTDNAAKQISNDVEMQDAKDNNAEQEEGTKKTEEEYDKDKEIVEEPPVDNKIRSGDGDEFREEERP